MRFDPSTCMHLWTVRLRDEIGRRLLLTCDRCKVVGLVPDPSMREWEFASYCKARPYRWNKKLNSRVEVVPAELMAP